MYSYNSKCALFFLYFLYICLICYCKKLKKQRGRKKSALFKCLNSKLYRSDKANVKVRPLASLKDVDLDSCRWTGNFPNSTKGSSSLWKLGLTQTHTSLSHLLSVRALWLKWRMSWWRGSGWISATSSSSSSTIFMGVFCRSPQVWTVSSAQVSCHHSSPLSWNIIPARLQLTDTRRRQCPIHTLVKKKNKKNTHTHTHTLMWAS